MLEEALRKITKLFGRLEWQSRLLFDVRIELVSGWKGF